MSNNPDIEEQELSEEEHEKITGHRTPELRQAYEEGYSNAQGVMTAWIQKWDGSTNSAMGEVLMSKFKKLKDII